MQRTPASLLKQVRHWLLRQGSVWALACLALATSGRAAAKSLDFPAIEQQEQSQWCWVAAAQNVLAQFSIDQTQSQIVSRASGGPVVNESATAAFVAKLLRSYGLDATDLQRTMSGTEMARVFAAGGKIIADTMPTPEEHAIVLQGFADDGAVVISDPFSGTSGELKLMDLYLNWRWIDAIVVKAAAAE